MKYELTNNISINNINRYIIFTNNIILGKFNALDNHEMLCIIRIAFKISLYNQILNFGHPSPQNHS